MIPFSPTFRTFSAWLKAEVRTSRYAQEVIKFHKLNPAATLKQLRSRKNIITSLAKVPFEFLNSTQRLEYRRSIQVLRLLRNEKYSMTSATKEMQISIKKVLANVGTAITKGKNGIYMAKKYDSLFRKLKIYEKGYLKSITVINYKDAQLIGKYHNAIQKLLYGKDLEALKEFEEVIIIDCNGIKHTLETDPNQIYLIMDRMENQEFFDLYAEE
ncbi:MAG: hypothetical protein WCV90_07260 [Candidatus Woesearchaeota archaeon]|jgi:hypothetical protein